MGRTLLVGHQGVSWREWLRSNRGHHDFLCLEPSDSDQSPPGRLTLRRGDRIVASRFFGSLEAQRSPHVLIDATHQLLALAGDDVIVQCFDYRSQPILHQTLLMIACLLRPERFLVGTGMLAGEAGLPIGPEEVDLPVQHELVRSAQRKAQWMKLVEQCEQHIVSLDEVTLDGARLGAGAPLSASDCDRLHLPDVQYAELAGGTLLVISSETPDSAEVARALDIAHATRAVFAAPEHYRHLLCGFAKASGEDFGIGMIQSIDFRSREAEILCTAVSPAPVRTLKFGSLRVTNQGHELGEVKPWAV